MNGVSFIVPTYKNPELLELCITSILNNKATYKNNFEIVIIIDGTINENKHILDKYNNERYNKNLTFLCSEVNNGMCVAMNIGVSYARYNKVLIINDDHVICDGWDAILLNDNIFNHISFPAHSLLYFESYEPTNTVFTQKSHDFGKTASTFKLEEWKQFSNVLEEWKQFSDVHVDIDSNVLQKSNTYNPRLPFMMYKYDYIALNGWDAHYMHGLVADDDFFLRTKLLGFTVYKLNDTCNFYHFGQSTVNNESLIKNNKLSRTTAEQTCYQYMLQKWGNKITRIVPKENTILCIDFLTNNVIVDDNKNELYE